MGISRWPLYIDPGRNGTVREFEAATGVSVEYIEEINDNVEIFAQAAADCSSAATRATGA